MPCAMGAARVRAFVGQVDVHVEGGARREAAAALAGRQAARQAPRLQRRKQAARPLVPARTSCA